MMSINLETSAWNSNFSALPLNDFSEMDSVSLHRKELSMLRYDVPVELGHKFMLTAFIAYHHGLALIATVIKIMIEHPFAISGMQ